MGEISGRKGKEWWRGGVQWGRPWGGGGKGKRALSTGGGAPGGTPGHQGGNGRDPKEQWEAMGEALGAEGATGETPRDGVCDGRPQR